MAMSEAQAKRVALVGCLAAGAVTAAGQISATRSTPELRVIVGTFGLAVVVTAVAEVAPQVAATAALAILATALFGISDAPVKALGALGNFPSKAPPPRAGTATDQSATAALAAE